MSGHGDGHGHSIKHYLHIAMLVHGFTTFPASLVFLIYTIGIALLKYEWHMLLWGIGTFLFAVFLFVFLSIAAE